MYRLLPLISLPFLLGGCLKAYTITALEPSMDGHYVIVQTRSITGSQKVYDCISRPDGTKYDPVCQRVEFREGRMEVVNDLRGRKSE